MFQRLGIPSRSQSARIPLTFTTERMQHCQLSPRAGTLSKLSQGLSPFMFMTEQTRHCRLSPRVGTLSKLSQGLSPFISTMARHHLRRRYRGAVPPSLLHRVHNLLLFTTGQGAATFRKRISIINSILCSIRAQGHESILFGIPKAISSKTGSASLWTRQPTQGLKDVYWMSYKNWLMMAVSTTSSAVRSVFL